MGGGGKGGSSVSSVQIPPEVLARYNAVNERAETVAQQPYQAYSNDPNAFVAPLTKTQQAGIQNTNAMAGAAQPYYAAATEQLMSAQQGAQPAMNAAYQNLGAAQNVGQQYANQAGRYYGQAQGAASPYYGASTAGVANALNYAQPFNQAAQQAAMGAQGASSPYYGAATAGTLGALQAGQAYMPAATQAALAGGQGVNAGQLQTDQYMSPYTKNVVEATQKGLQQQFGQQMAQQQADAIRSGAFGGDRSGVQRAILQGQQGLAQAQAISPLYQQAYNNALQTAMQQQGVNLGAAQANRAAQAQMGQQLAALGQQGYGQNLGAAQQMAGLGQALFGQGIQGAQTLSQLGQTGFGQGLSSAQQMQNLGKDIYGQNLQTGQAMQGLGQQQFGQGTGIAQQLAALAQQNYGMGAGTSQALANLGSGAQAAGLAGAQAQMGAGATEQQTQQAGLQAMYNQFMQKQGYPFQIAQFLANIAEGTGALSGNTTSTTMASDRRLKENVEKVGETNDGQPIYRYNFKGDPRTQIGLMAQEVEKDHPEAVDESKGYKSVDYKKATEDAIHKVGGGEVDGMGRYSMLAPSDMLQRSGGLGALTLPQMRTGSDIAIKPGANMAEIAAMRAPVATGLSPGSLESAKAQYASLSGITPQSGEDYGSYKLKQLSDFLAKYGEKPPETMTVSSQGGLVGPAGGYDYSRGGYAGDGYVHPGLQFYGPQGAKGAFDGSGPYGATLTPSQARQLLQGTKPPEDRRPTGIQQATQIGQLGTMAGGAWKERPDFMRSDEDLAQMKKVADYKNAIMDKTLADINKVATGGMIEGRHHYAGLGYVDPSSGPYGNSDDNSLGAMLTKPQPHYELLKPNERRQMPQESGLGTAMQIASLTKTGLGGLKDAKSAADWVGGKLAGDAAGEAASKGVIDLTTKAPGLGAAAAPEAVTAAVPEAAAAAAPEVLAGVGETAAAAAPEVMAAAAPEILDFLPFLFLKDGGAVPRHHYAGDDGSFVTPPRADRFTGADTGEPMSEEDMAALKKMAKETTVLPANAPARIAATKPAEAPAEAPAKPAARPAVGEVGAGRAPYSHFMSQLLPESMGSGTKAALTSENLWAPALAGIGAAMASRAPTRGQAIGEGLVGATTAYTGLQKQQSATDLEQAKQRRELVNAGRESIIYNQKTGLPIGVLVSTPTGMQQIDFGEAWDKRDSLPLTPATIAEMKAVVERNPEIVQQSKAPAGGAKAETGAGAGTSAGTPAAGATGRVTTRAPAATEERAETAPAAKPSAVRPVEEIFSVDKPTEGRVAEEVRKRIGTDTSAIKDEFTAKTARAQDSREQKPLLMELGSAFAGLPAESLMASGAGAPVATTLAGWGNWLAGAVGASPVVQPADIARAEKIQKVTAQMNKAVNEASGQKSYSAYESMGKMFPTMATSREGMAENFANIVVTNQMPDDENRFAQDWFKKANKVNPAYAVSTGPAVSEAFKDKFSPLYEKEKKAISGMFLDPVVKKGGEPVLDPETKRPMNYFQYVSTYGKDFSPEVKKAIETKYGEGILRYFPNIAR